MEMFMNSDLAAHAEGEDMVYPAERSSPNTCPICGCTDLVYECSEMGDDAVEYPWRCPQCGHSGTEWGNICFDGHRVHMDVTAGDDVRRTCRLVESEVKVDKGLAFQYDMLTARLGLPIKIGEEAEETWFDVRYSPILDRLFISCRLPDHDFPSLIDLDADEKRVIINVLERASQDMFGMRIEDAWRSSLIDDAVPMFTMEDSWKHESLRIKYGRLELFAKHRLNDSSISIAGFSVDRVGPIYKLQSSESFESNREVVSLHKYIDQEIKAQAQAALEAYVAKNLYKDVYAVRHHKGEREDFGDFLLRDIEHPIETRCGGLAVPKSRLLQGLFMCAYGNRYLVYDIFSKKIYHFGDSMHEAVGSELVEDVYDADQRALEIVRAQKKAGIAPPAVSEIARINCWLREKKSVRMILKSGDEYVYKDQYASSISLSYLLCASTAPNTKYPVLSLRDSRWLRPILSGGIPAKELHSLKFGRDELVVDVAALQDFRVRQRPS